MTALPVPEQMCAISDAEAAFRAAMVERGLIPPRELRIGKIGRCPTVDKPRGDAGAYILHLDGRAAGAIINFGDGGGWVKWKMSGHVGNVDRAVWEARAAERKIEQAKAHADGRARAAAMWESYRPAGDAHPYLVRKGVRAHGTRISDRGFLVVPAHDGQGLATLQFIAPSGQKRFARGAPKASAGFRIGEIGTGPMLIAEGFATAATLHEATGYCVVVAFDAGNLLRVAKVARAALPRHRIVLAGDDDWRTDGNPGWACAARAARAIDGELRLPGPWPSNRGDKDTDFNDLARLCGADAVRACINGGEP